MDGYLIKHLLICEFESEKRKQTKNYDLAKFESIFLALLRNTSVYTHVYPSMVAIL